MKAVFDAPMSLSDHAEVFRHFSADFRHPHRGFLDEKRQVTSILSYAEIAWSPCKKSSCPAQFPTLDAVHLEAMKIIVGQVKNTKLERMRPMAIITNRPLGAGFNATRILSDLVAKVAAWNDARVTRKALSALSNRELDDLGLNRGDIEDIASGRHVR
ncbi:DUF1127 domain-containing protein [Gymnodinialimonas hymeniacidonis]|uniref:DUF1127 domain-containing protein n=1 Tax=Gymnodinialimonas hymeniacidonis TaxID=3126508 RepID=UPI003F716487